MTTAILLIQGFAIVSLMAIAVLNLVAIRQAIENVAAILEKRKNENRDW